MTLSQIEAAIRYLPSHDLAELVRWLGQFVADQIDQDAWDQKIAADSAAGKLDAFAESALKEAGQATDL